MKKISTVMLCLLLVLSMAGCGGKFVEKTNTTTPPKSEQEIEQENEVEKALEAELNKDETLSYQVEAAGDEHYKIEETAEENRQPSGTTEQFQYAGLKLEVSNVINVRTERMTDDGGTVCEYQVYTCHPDAEVTVLNADMEDGELFEDKLPHAKWGFVQLPDETRLRITEELEQTKTLCQSFEELQVWKAISIF